MTNSFHPNTINDLIAESVYGPAGENTQPCANAWEVSKLIAGLHARIQILENRLEPPDSNPQVNEPGSLDYRRQAFETWLMDGARIALAQPEPEGVGEGPTLDDIGDLCEKHSFNCDDGESTEILQEMITDALARWGRPAIEPVPEGLRLDRYELGDAIRRSWLKHGRDSWCSIADDVLAELPGLAQPEPEGVTDEDLYQFWESRPELGLTCDKPVKLLRAGLARYARAYLALKPVPVAERLPGPEDCLGRPWEATDAGFCWWLFFDSEKWCFLPGPIWQGQGSWQRSSPLGASHWLPHHALPIPSAEME
jgi:hypothetical protein